MSADNAVTLVGNVTRDPELRKTGSGASVVGFGLAVSRRYQKDGEWVEEPNFYDITAWNSLADNVTTSVTKGMRVVVFGRLNQQTWETDTGDKRSRVEVVAEDVAPSLRWATAAVTKNPKGSGGNTNAPNTSAPAYAPPADEEPFRVDAGDWMPGMFGSYPERMLP